MKSDPPTIPAKAEAVILSLNVEAITSALIGQCPAPQGRRDKRSADRRLGHAKLPLVPTAEFLDVRKNIFEAALSV